MTKIVSLLASLVFAAGAALIGAQPASAAAPHILNVCNSSVSTGGSIVVTSIYDADHPVRVYPGECWGVFNGEGQARVEVYGQSYRVGIPGEGYGPCHNSPYVSNPPNITKVYYKTFRLDSCRG